MTFEIGMTVEHDAFTTLGPTPKIEGWVNVKRATDLRYMAWRKGFSIAFGIRPLRFAWRGIWRIHP